MSRQFDRHWYSLVSRGLVQGHYIRPLFGNNKAVPNGSLAWVNRLGFTGWPISTPTTVRIKAGGNAADSAAGVGAREVEVEGIDNNLNRIKVLVTTNGAAASAATTELFWRVDGLDVTQCGTYGGSNVGEIILENGAGGTDLISIGPGAGASQYGAMSVEAGFTAYYLYGWVVVDASKPADVFMFTRENFTTTTPPVSTKRLRIDWDGATGYIPFEPKAPLGPINALTDIWTEALGDGNNTQVTVEMQFLLIEDGF